MKKVKQHKILSVFLSLCIAVTNCISASALKYDDVLKQTEFSCGSNNNIDVVKYDNIPKVWYFYDENNQLIRENNLLQNQTIEYSYDKNMNILSKKSMSLHRKS